LKRLFCVLALLTSGLGQNSASDKQQILWQKLDASVHEVSDHLDGVADVATKDLTSGRPS
jgi:hypothetical protein